MHHHVYIYNHHCENFLTHFEAVNQHSYEFSPRSTMIVCWSFTDSITKNLIHQLDDPCKQEMKHNGSQTQHNTKSLHKQQTLSGTGYRVGDARGDYLNS